MDNYGQCLDNNVHKTDKTEFKMDNYGQEYIIPYYSR